MSVKPRKLKVASPEDYYRTTQEIDANNPDVFELIEKIGDEARRLPRGYKVMLGILARKAYPPEISYDTPDGESADIARVNRLRVCRALGFGAAAGAIIGELAHEWPDVMHDAGEFAVIDWGAETPEEFITETHEVVGNLEPIVGTPTMDWLRMRAENMAMTGDIDNDFRSWFVVGASQSLGMLYSNANA